MRALYTLLLGLAMPLILLRLWWRGRLAPAYRERIAERFARVPGTIPAGVLWFHAVSVGETIAAVPLIRAVRAQRPGLPILVTSTTPTGSERVQALLGDTVSHCYLPYDLPALMRRFIQRVQPQALVILETELWPNTVATCRAAGVPVVLANARLSEKSARGYARLASLTRGMLAGLHTVAVQNAEDGERFIRLGLPRERLQVTGSVKFDVTVPDTLKAHAQQLRQDWTSHGTRPMWIAASTHDGEDSIVLAAHRRLRERFPGLRLLLVPRHPERFARVSALAADSGFRVFRRSEAGLPPEDVAVIVGDSMGELLLFYGVADVAFVGGSLLPIGGHNLLEPAAWGVPVLCGPHRYNFLEISRLLETAGALQTVADAGSLADAVSGLLADGVARQRMADAGLAVLAANRGAVVRQCDAILAVLTAG